MKAREYRAIVSSLDRALALFEAGHPASDAERQAFERLKQVRATLARHAEETDADFGAGSEAGGG